MAQYQRFLSYLFEYEGDQKKENCGFAKKSEEMYSVFSCL